MTLVAEELVGWLTQVPMTTKRHAEIAGAGLSGLTTAAALARQGWSVRVHERSSELREIGAGIFLWENALRALEDVGAFDGATERGERILQWELFDERQRQLQGEWMSSSLVRLYIVLRTDLHRALANAAQEAGVEIVTRSRVVGAREEGVLVLESGQEHEADLVVGADGVNSPVRDSLGLALAVQDLRDGCGRYLIPRRPSDPVGRTLEYWNAGRRIGVVPCSPMHVYIYLCCPSADLAGREHPVDHETWIESFPHLEGVIERIRPDGRWLGFHDVQCHRWTKGKVAILGDAAHAMSPNLGQGACIGMANARSLAYALNRDEPVETALQRWEATERPIADSTQRYSRLYGRVGTRWPPRLLRFRSTLVTAAGKSQRLQARVNAAAGYESPLVPQIEGPPDSADPPLAKTTA
jgi:2-polyprenyl-6-methoxyphenol hydroxylase-like FAD-dependent oxidoreductase